MKAARDAYDEGEGELTDVMLDKIITEMQKFSANKITISHLSHIVLQLDTLY